MILHKYYIPVINEMAIGVNYQVKYPDGWIDFKVNEKTHIPSLILEIEENTVRVKKLDREDIENLGWAIDNEHCGYQYFKSNGFGLNLSDSDEMNISISRGGAYSYYQIRNKKELELLMQFRNIKNED